LKSWGSIEPLCKSCLPKLIEVKDDARNATFDTLIGQAKKHCEVAQKKQQVLAYAADAITAAWRV
jgi:hypothetical protein